MSQDRTPRRSTTPLPSAPTARSGGAEKRSSEAPPTNAEDASQSKREPWIEQWLADEEDDVWNMPCTD